MSVSTNPNPGRVGDPIIFTLAVEAIKEVSLNFSTAQRFEFVVFDEVDLTVWQYSDEQSFTQVLGEDVLEPGDTREHKATFTPTVPGNYRVSASIPARNAEFYEGDILLLKIENKFRILASG